MKIKSKLLLVMLLAVMLCIFAACSASEEPIEGDVETATGAVHIDILFPEEAGMEDVIDAQVVIFDSADSVLDALVQYGRDFETPVVIEKGATFSYVTGINGVFENDYMEPSGWVFTLNGEMVMEDASLTQLVDGDYVVWEFVAYDSIEMAE